MRENYFEESDILTVEDMAELMGGKNAAQGSGSIEEEEVPLLD